MGIIIEIYAQRLCKNKERLSLIECDQCSMYYISAFYTNKNKIKCFCKSCGVKGNKNGQFGLKGELSPNFGENNPFYGKTHSLEMRKKLSKINKELYKDKTRHPSYNPSISDEDRKPRDIKHDEWAKAIKERDYWTCQITNEKIKKIVAHHLNSYANNKDSRTDTNNGITILKDIHILFHKTYGYKNNTKVQFEQFKQSILNSYC